jgi:hypothetical protein
MHDMRNAYKILVQKPKGKIPFGRIILKLMLKEWDVVVWTGSSWLRMRV